MQPSIFSHESLCETASSTRDKSQGRGMEILWQSLGFFLILQQLESLSLNCMAHSSAGKRCLLRQQLIPFYFPTESVSNGLISKLIGKLQGCSWKRFTVNLKSSLFINYHGSCLQLVLGYESHVRFKGMLFLNSDLKYILMYLELLRTMDIIGIHAHRNEIQF